MASLFQGISIDVSISTRSRGKTVNDSGSGALILSVSIIQFNGMRERYLSNSVFRIIQNKCFEDVKNIL